MSPDKRAEDWNRLILPGSGRKYFYNVATGESRWDINIEGGPYSSNVTRVSTQSQQYRGSKTLTCKRDQVHNGRLHSSQQNYSSFTDNIDQPQYGIRHRRQHSYEYMSPIRPERQRSQGPGSLPRVSCHQTPQLHHFANNTGRWSLSKSVKSTRTAGFDPQHNISDTKETKRRNTTAKAPPMTNQDTVDLFQTSLDPESKPDNYNKDYIRLSKQYKLMERYRIKPNFPRSLDSPRPICISCQQRSQKIDKVLFPCEHVCICTSCLKSSLPRRCPLCKESIRQIFDIDGRETENYWKWIEEVGAIIFFIFYGTSDSLHLLITSLEQPKHGHHR